MKRSFTLAVLLFTLSLFNANAQPTNLPTEGPAFYFNNFQNYKGKKADSALYWARMLASDKSNLEQLQDLLHNSYASIFMKSLESEMTDSIKLKRFLKARDTARSLLSALVADSNDDLKNTALPIYYWVLVQENENDEKRLQELVTEFKKTQLATNDLYTNRVGRYALLIHQVIVTKSSLQPMAEQLLMQVKKNIQKNQVTVEGSTPELALRPILRKRSWYRYIYAYINSMEGKTLLSNNKIKEAGPYLKTAFEYSPDMLDITKGRGFSNDNTLLTNEDDPTFQSDYIGYLIKYSTDKQQTLNALLSTALIDPSTKEQLKSFYNSNFSDRESFNEFWLKSVNKIGKKAPDVSLTQMDGTPFSFSNSRNKWILLDFWGTWCGPCRREHPEIEQFYKKINSSYTEKITMLTIACNDQADFVTSYMNQNKYTFPVAISDKQIEKNYNINSYPSKILISPQGKYLVIPFGYDWVDYIKKYADL